MIEDRHVILFFLKDPLSLKAIPMASLGFAWLRLASLGLAKVNGEDVLKKMQVFLLAKDVRGELLDPLMTSRQIGHRKLASTRFLAMK
jgi:hypothetical protein